MLYSELFSSSLNRLEISTPIPNEATPDQENSGNHRNVKQLKLKELNHPNRTHLALDIQLLMEEAFHLSRTDFWIKKNDLITDQKALRFFYTLLKRLSTHEPIAYILKKREFYGENFVVNKNVLIPRPETEILVEKALDLIKSIKLKKQELLNPSKSPSNSPIRVLDIGAGSGIISIMLAKLAEANVTAVDISPNALYVLKKNISLHNMKGKVKPVLGDLFPKRKHSKFDMIVSNPPYIPEKEWKTLDSCVKSFEPKLALTPGEDGFSIIRRIAEESKFFLANKGLLLMEIGWNQSHTVQDILNASGFSNIEFTNDYSGIPRIVSAHLNLGGSNFNENITG